MKQVSQSFLDQADQVFTQATQEGAMHLYTEDQSLNGRQIQLQGRSVVNFGSCSYLGLEMDPRLIQGCIKAAEKYGTQFSSSRAYVSSGQYLELESLFTALYHAHCLVMPTTTLGHISALPALVDPGDIIILDHQVHGSVNTASQLIKARGDKVDMIRHNQLDELEDRIKKYRATHRHIWYCIDGVYSMYGDLAPMDQLYQMLDQYPQLHIYADDAHGISWAGKKGRGTILGSRIQHERLVVAVSLNKAFATAGGLLIFPNIEMKRRVRACGAGVVFSGPIQPPMLGAAIESAKIHLSGEVATFQEKLMERIHYTRELIQEFNLPDVANAESPIFYIGVGQLKVGYHLIRRILAEGYYVNLGLFPAVALNRTGIRFTTTVHHEKADLKGLIEAMAYHLPFALNEEESSLSEVRRAFQLPDHSHKKQQTAWKLEEFNTCTQLPLMWDRLVGTQGSYDRNGLSALEASFSQNAHVAHEHQWRFKYLIIRDLKNNIVLATFATHCWIKSDLFASADLSQKAEQVRKEDPYAFCSPTIMQGTGLTEGPHMYLDRHHKDWKSAVTEWLKWMVNWREQTGAEVVCLRDFYGIDPELDDLLQGKSFLRVKLPDSHKVDHPLHFNEETFLQNLRHNHRRHWRKAVLPFIDHFTINIVESDRDWENSSRLTHWYTLYRQVYQRAWDINTFPLPKTLFANLMRTPDWEALELYVKDNEQCVAVVFQYWNGKKLCPIVLGMDYQYLDQGVYRQALYHVMTRAKSLNSEAFLMGFGASLEKRRMGARNLDTYAYMQTIDTFDLTALDSISSE